MTTSNDLENSELAALVVRKLLMKRVDEDNPQSISDIITWFPRQDREEITNVINKLVNDETAPVEFFGDSQHVVFITNPKEAMKYSNPNLKENWKFGEY